MHDAGLMRGRERRGGLPADAERVGERHPAALAARGQRLAAQHLHRDEHRAGVLVVRIVDDAALVHGDDAGVLDLRGGTRLAQEALHDLAVGQVLGAQDLERDVAIEAGVAREVDHAVAAPADDAVDDVLADLGASHPTRRIDCYLLRGSMFRRRQTSNNVDCDASPEIGSRA